MKVNSEEEATTNNYNKQAQQHNSFDMNFSCANTDMLSKLELCYVAVWGKSLLSTHMLVGSSNRNVEIFCCSNNSCVC